MAGYSKIYVVGGQGGFMGADGVNPIEFLLVGDADRQWLEPKYFDNSILPIGKLQVIYGTPREYRSAILRLRTLQAWAYFQVRDLVKEITNPAQIAGILLLRGGVPIIDLTGSGQSRVARSEAETAENLVPLVQLDGLRATRT